MFKKDKQGKHQSRREFFKSIVRNGLFASLVGGSAYLVAKKKGEDGCTFDFICQKCRKNSFCQLPEASLFRLKNRKKDESRG